MAFPETALLDTFNGYADGTLLKGTADWQSPPTNDGIWDGLQVMSGHAQGAFDWGRSGSYWNHKFGTNQEFYWKWIAPPGVYDETMFFFKMVDTAAEGGGHGYYIWYYFDGSSEEYTLYCLNPSGSVVSLATYYENNVAKQLKAGSRSGVSYKDGTITVYRDNGTGWETVLTYNDSTYLTDEGYVGWGFRKSTTVIDDFGGGTLTTVPTGPNTYIYPDSGVSSEAAGQPTITQGPYRIQPVASARATNSSATANTTVALPSTGIKSGDVAVAFYSVKNASVITTPGGWTLAGATASTTVLKTHVFWKTLTAADLGANVVFTAATAAKAVANIYIYRNVHNTAPIELITGQANAASTNHAAPSLTLTNTFDWVVANFADTSTTAITLPASLTAADATGNNRTTGGTANTNVSQSTGTKEQAAAGATGTFTATGSNQVSIGYTVALKLAPNQDISAQGGSSSEAGGLPTITAEVVASDQAINPAGGISSEAAGQPTINTAVSLSPASGTTGEAAGLPTITAAAPSSGTALALSFKMQEVSGTILTEGVNGFNATQSGLTATNQFTSFFKGSSPGRAIQNNGSSGSYSTATGLSAHLDNSKPFTWSVWFNGPSVMNSDLGRLISIRDTNGFEWFNLYKDYDTINFQITGSDGTRASFHPDPSLVKDSTWTFLAGVFDPTTNVCTIYVGDQSGWIGPSTQSASEGSATFAPADRLYLLNRADGNRGLNGLEGPVYIWQGALTETELHAVFDDPYNPPYSGSAPAPTTLSVQGGASSEAAGQPTINTAISLNLLGGASSEAAGQPTLNRNVNITPDGAASGEASGQPTLSTAVSLNLLGGSSQEAAGQPSFVPGGVFITPDGGASQEAAGYPTFVPGGVTLTLQGGASDEAAGQPTILASGTVLSLEGGASGEAAGQPTISTAVTLGLAGGASSEASGQPQVKPDYAIGIEGAGSGEAAGQPSITTNRNLTLLGGASSEAAGRPALVYTELGINVQGGASSEAPGYPTILPGGVSLPVQGGASGEDAGKPSFQTTVQLPVEGGESGEAAGQPELVPGNVTLFVEGGASGEEAGQPFLVAGAIVLGIIGGESGEAGGEPTISADYRLDLGGQGAASGGAAGLVRLVRSLNPGRRGVSIVGSFNDIELPDNGIRQAAVIEVVNEVSVEDKTRGTVRDAQPNGVRIV